jgi:hypothetical protein
MKDIGKQVNPMSDGEVRKIIDKLSKLRALSHARERVRRLERELYGEPSKPEDSAEVPGVLSQRQPLRIV